MPMKEIDKAIYTAEIKNVKTLLKMCLIMQKYMITLIDNNNESITQFGKDNVHINYNSEQITKLQTDLSTETTQRKTVDNVLDERINNISNQFNYTGEWVNNNEYNKGDVINVIYENNYTLAISNTNHTSGDTFANDVGYWDILITENDTQIDERLDDLQTQITSNVTDISNEVTNRTKADDNLQTQITANKTSISTEITNRTNADDNLQNQLNTKVLWEHAITMLLNTESGISCNISFNYKDNSEEVNFDNFIEVVNNGNTYISNNSGATNIVIGIEDLGVSNSNFELTLVVLLSDFTTTTEQITVNVDDYQLIEKQII